MSHFSFTRSKYDKCALDKKQQESTDPFNWITDNSNTEHKKQCFLSAASPFMQNPFRSIPKDKIDIESDLMGYNFNLSQCPEFKYNPNTQKNYDIPFNECLDKQLVPEYTRINKPCNVLSGININRFHPLCEDLQVPTKIHSNDFIGVNTRLQVKDNFKKPERQTNLPKQAPGPRMFKNGYFA